MTWLRRVLPLVLIALLSGGCLFGDDDKPPSPNALRKTPTSEARSGSVEANVIKGVVRDEQGDPVSGARINIAGFTGNPNGQNGADFIKVVTTDRRGAYRLDVPRGLYGITATADVSFGDKSYKELYLHPEDGDCEKEASDRGIVKDFVLRLSGFMECATNPDPNNDGFYSGAAIALIPQGSSLPGDARLTFTLTPVGALADGSGGKTLTFKRSFADLKNFFGPIESTNTLHDIPLGRYRLTGVATLTNGQRQTLLFAANNGGGAPTETHAVEFPAKELLPFGIGRAEVAVHVGGGAEPAPATSQPASPTTTAPNTTTTCFSEHVGPIPCG